MTEKQKELQRYTLRRMLDFAHAYSLENSGCNKVQVGSVIGFFDPRMRGGFGVESYGANRCIPNKCKTEGCLRVKKYGEDSKNHRLPADCRAVHSELDAIIGARGDVNDEIICVTRYPCEACARAIVRAGLSMVAYGRQQKISAETEEIFKSGGVEVIHIPEWDAEDTTR